MLQVLFSLSLYKRTQGRVARQSTFAASFLIALLGVWRLSFQLSGYDQSIRYGLPAVLALLAFWITYRLIHWPKFADFLIAVEAEMNKVSWPSRPELIRSSGVVMFTIFSLAGLLFVFDTAWAILFRWIGIR